MWPQAFWGTKVDQMTGAAWTYYMEILKDLNWARLHKYQARCERMENLRAYFQTSLATKYIALTDEARGIRNKIHILLREVKPTEMEMELALCTTLKRLFDRNLAKEDMHDWLGRVDDAYRHCQYWNATCGRPDYTVRQYLDAVAKHYPYHFYYWHRKVAELINEHKEVPDLLEITASLRQEL